MERLSESLKLRINGLGNLGGFSWNLKRRFKLEWA